jgi:hypothetical protein
MLQNTYLPDTNRCYKAHIYLTPTDMLQNTYLQLNNILHSYNLTSIITFPMRIQNNSATTIDNIFLDPLRFQEYSVVPIPNGLSDHDA